MEKTRVIIKQDTPQCSLIKGMIGYIDGYCRGGDNIPYAIVVCGYIIDMVPLYALEIYLDIN